jgi:hypothetical protein
LVISVKMDEEFARTGWLVEPDLREPEQAARLAEEMANYRPREWLVESSPLRSSPS